MLSSPEEKGRGKPERMTAAEFRSRQKPEKPRKYRNTPVVIDGIRFDSKAEGKRWCQLKLLEKTGSIYGLRRQVPYDLPGCRYRADFDYFLTDSGEPVTEDVKGVLTTAFKIKAKLFKAQYGREIKVVRA